jgi:hypothetical protein
VVIDGATDQASGIVRRHADNYGGGEQSSLAAVAAVPDVDVLNIKRSAQINLPPFLRSVLSMSACVSRPDRIVVTINASARVATPALGGLSSRPTCSYVDAVRAGSSRHNRIANCHNLELANCDILVVVDDSDVTSTAIAGSLIRFSQMVVDGPAD